MASGDGTQTAEVIDLLAARREGREARNRQELQALGIRTREDVLLHRNALVENAAAHYARVRWLSARVAQLEAELLLSDALLKATESLLALERSLRAPEQP